MFQKKTDYNSTSLRMAIDKLFENMSHVSPDSPEFEAMVKQMDVLYKLREVDANVNVKKRVSPEAIATIAANLLGIAMIVEYERTHVVTSKAMSFVKSVFR